MAYYYWWWYRLHNIDYIISMIWYDIDDDISMIICCCSLYEAIWWLAIALSHEWLYIYDKLLKFLKCKWLLWYITTHQQYTQRCIDVLNNVSLRFVRYNLFITNPSHVLTMFLRLNDISATLPVHVYLLDLIIVNHIMTSFVFVNSLIVHIKCHLSIDLSMQFVYS